MHRCRIERLGEAEAFPNIVSGLLCQVETPRFSKFSIQVKHSTELYKLNVTVTICLMVHSSI